MKRLEVMGENALSRKEEKASQTVKDANYLKRMIPGAPADPIIIGTGEGVGTARCRANHVSAQLDYCEEQEFLKKMQFKIV